jgi:hypothetical protein
MVSATSGGIDAADRTRLGRRKEQQMKFASHRRGRTAARARDARRQARHVLRRGRAGALMLGLAAAAAIAVPASASASPVVGHVYVNDNTKGTNTIGAFDRHADGSLTPVAGSAFAAGGAGTGAGLASQGAIQITPDGRFLIAVDAGSNQISVLRIHFDGSLSLVSVTGSGGTLPDSVAVHGTLTLLGSTPVAATGGVGAVDARLSPDGRFLYVDESRIGKVGAFAVNGGNLTELGTSPFALPAGATPAGIVVGLTLARRTGAAVRSRRGSGHTAGRPLCSPDGASSSTPATAKNARFCCSRRVGCCSDRSAGTVPPD